MLKYIKSFICQSLAVEKIIKADNMSPIAPSNLPESKHIDFNYSVSIDDILAGSLRKRKNDLIKDTEESSDEEKETHRAVKKRTVKVVSDEDEDKKSLVYEKEDGSYYEVKKVIPKQEKVSEHESKGLSSYEKMIQKKRAERIALLKSMEIYQIKEEISEAVGGIKQIKKNSISRSYKKIQSASTVEPIRRSKRLANLEVDFSENALEKLAVKNAFQFSPVDYAEPIPDKLTFEAALKSGSPYEGCIKDLNVQKSKYNKEFISYEKAALKKLTLNDFNVCKVVPARITSAAWYPSKDDLVVAAGDKYGSVGLWKIQDSETTPHLFKFHAGNIPNMQFNLFDPVQLITASYDGTMRCGDLVKHTFNEIYESDGPRVTWFDFLSPTTFLVSHSNGEVALFDSKTKGKTSEKTYACHDYTIKTVCVHPVNKNVFVTTDNRTSIRLWDLRKLQKKPFAEILHHKKCVNSVFFSPVTGNSLLSTSLDDSICIFDSTKLTQDIKLKAMITHNNFTGRWLTIFRATWLPNSDDLFAVGSMEQPRRIEIYDKDLNMQYNMINDNLTTVTSVHRFHPYRNVLAGGNSSGKLFVFT